MTSGGAGTLPRIDLRSLTGMRFIAALLVFVHHIGTQGVLSQGTNFMNPGMVGVSFFFVLSGFLLAWTAREGDSKALFWRRRFARIYPAYFVAWAAVMAFKFSLEGELNKTDLLPVTLLQDWIPSERFYFGGTAVFWSLSCEAFFYLVFPFVFPLLAKLTSTQRLWAIGGIVLALIAIAALAHPMTRGSLAQWFLYIFPPVRFLEFAVGILAALHLKSGELRRVPLWWGMTFFGAMYLAAAFAPASFVPVSLTIVPVALLVVAAAQADLNHSWSPFRGKVLVRLGAWSYAFYLLHTTVIAAVFLAVSALWGIDRATADGLPLAGTVLAALVIAVAVAGLLYQFVEAPLEKRLRPKRRQSSHRALVDSRR